MNPRALEDKIIDSLSFFVWLTFFGGTGIFQCLCVCICLKASVFVYWEGIEGFF